jgi:hypothetical protein
MQSIARDGEVNIRSFVPNRGQASYGCGGCASPTLPPHGLPLRTLSHFNVARKRVVIFSVTETHLAFGLPMVFGERAGSEPQWFLP